MSEQLPIHIDHNTHPYLIKLVYAYRPFQELYVDTDLTSDDIKTKTHLSLKELCKQMGVDYTQEIKKRQ